MRIRFPRQGRSVSLSLRRWLGPALVLSLLVSALSVAAAEAQQRRFAWQEVGGWVPFQTVCQSTDMLGVDLDCRVARVIMTDDGPINWAGVVTDLNYDPATGRFDRVRLEVVMRNDQSTYRCGAIIERQIAGLRDFPGIPLGITVCPESGWR